MSFEDIITSSGVSIWLLLILLFLSVLTVGTVIERLWFWSRVFLREKKIINEVLDTAATGNFGLARNIVYDYRNHPVGRFLYAPLRLDDSDPEVFHLALEASADDELSQMRRGDKVLEAVIALSPLLGLLGTVLGLINSLSAIQISDLGTASTAGVTLGIGEALISTAAGLIVAITSLAFYRLFQAFWFGQMRIFRKTGNELEVLYRQQWVKFNEIPSGLSSTEEAIVIENE